MSPAFACSTRSTRRALWLALFTLLLTASCGGDSGGEATPIPSAQTTPTATKMLPIVTPTPGTLGSPSPTANVENTPTAAEEPAGEGEAYVVEAGDTLESIAAKFDVTVEALKVANGVEDPNDLATGQTLTIP